MKSSVLRLLFSLSSTGLALAALFFALSLTPSLMPRSYAVQGALSGVCASAGYLLGILLAWLWRYLELPMRRGPGNDVLLAVAFLGLLVAIVFLWQTADWQNSIRELWHMPPVDSADPFKLAGVAAAVFTALFLLGTLFRSIFVWLSTKFSKRIPHRLAMVFGLTLTCLLFWSIGQGILLRAALHVADSSFQAVDAAMDEDIPAPSQMDKTGGPQSLVSWRGLGRQGRHFIASGPTASSIGDFWQAPAKEPIRVYVGLNNANTVEQRAKLALRELQRQGGFDRSLLVIIVPTGTGWVDPAAMDTLEYLHRGDVASVSLQYSYLSSWLSILVEPEYGAESARALFREIYGYWTSLPHDKRPKLYLYGLSLGALNSQLSTDLLDVVGDPYQGALWSGPPFQSEMWRTVTEGRLPGSPAWLPRFRDGSIIRFTNQENALELPGATWGTMRIVYLQYASDAVTFFEPQSFYREPAWMKGKRGPDVSPRLRWVPVVTMLQLLVDMTIATTSPIGYGHVYAPQHYIDAWVAVTAPAISADQINALKRRFSRGPSG
ncbi:alpha/beta-hydrolase family protein [Rhizobium sp. BR 317]|uniref:alpha/beta hydrolase n=1 Tax=Rhizobium sp. BR 317 TaxID=3040015 RepID=UPI0039BF9A22